MARRLKVVHSYPFWSLKPRVKVVHSYTFRSLKLRVKVVHSYPFRSLELKVEVVHSYPFRSLELKVKVKAWCDQRANGTTLCTNAHTSHMLTLAIAPLNKNVCNGVWSLEYNLGVWKQCWAPVQGWALFQAVWAILHLYFCCVVLNECLSVRVSVRVCV